MRVALYARCSTTEQTVAPQLDGLHEYAALRKLDVAGEYVDEGVSGSKARRPALDRLLVDARRRRFDAVAVWRLDRLARSVRHLVNLAGDLDALGIDLIVLDQGIDTSTSAGRFLFHTLGAVGELERDLIIERTRSGMASARRRGKRIGRPRVHVPVAEARRLLKQGLSLAAVARELRLSRSTLRRALAKRIPPGVPATPLQTVRQ